MKYARVGYNYVIGNQLHTEYVIVIIGIHKKIVNYNIIRRI